jgi:glycosyltransferase involved in cell wall biosynthesis
MKILWVKSNLLHPIDSGGAIRTYNMLRLLKANHRITYVTLATGVEAEARGLAPEYCDRLIALDWPGAPRRNDWRFYLQAVRNLVHDMPLALGRYHHPPLRDALHDLTTSEIFDLAVSDFLFPATHFAGVASTPKLLFQHNVETLIWDRMAARHRGLAGKYLKAQARRMRSWEGRLSREFDLTVTVSDEDGKLMREWFSLDNTQTIPTGVDVEFFSPGAQPPAPGKVVFVGSLDWLPNIDAVRWLVGDIWPRIRSLRRGVSLHIVGRRPGRVVQRAIRRAPDVFLWGDVDDVRAHLWDAEVVVVPLRVGGGTRLKIFEALACEKPVVTTPVGAEGLPVVHGTHVLFGSDSAELAQAVVSLLDDSARRRQLGLAGRALVVERYSWSAVVAVFEEACESAVRSFSARASS